MTADFELWLRGSGRYRHTHAYDWYDFTLHAYRCRCGALPPLSPSTRRLMRILFAEVDARLKRAY